jgi:hypothetical protein
MRVTLPPSATEVAVTGPGGEKLEASARGGLAVVPEVRRAGLYHVSWQGPQAGSVVVPTNLTSEAESDVRTKPIETAAAGVVVTAAAAQPDAHNEWAWVLALIALAFVVFDVAYFTRKPRSRPEPQRTAPVLPERRRA